MAPSNLLPLHPDVGIIALVPNAWGGMWMPREHVLTRLGHSFHVVWMDPPREWRSWWAPGATPPAPLSVVPEGAYPGFHVYRPGRFLPEIYRPDGVRRLLWSLRLNAARRELIRRGARRIVLYLWRAEFGPALDLVTHDLSCYHIDDEYSFSPAERPMDLVEAALIRRVDQVFIHSPALMEKKGRLNGHTAFVPNGVDFAAFTTPTPEPVDLVSIPHPRVGYVGIIKEQLDLRLLAEVARARPNWSLVLVGPSRLAGPSQALFAEITALPNVHHLGGKPVQDLPAYTQHFDAGIMPYVLDDYTKYIFPMKLHEYLAAGLPTVGTPIRSLQDFGAVVRLARTAPEWLAALDAALHPLEKLPERVMARRAVAKEFDWGVLVNRIADILARRLGLPSFTPVL